MTKSEFNRISNFLDERGNEQGGRLEIYSDKKTVAELGPRPWFNFYKISIVDGVATLNYKDFRTGEIKKGKFPRKRIKSIYIREIYGWEDVRGERQKRLSKIL